MKMTKSDHPLLSAAIARAEEKTGAELVLVIEPHSGRYGDLHAAVGAIGATLGLVFVLFSDWDFDPLHVVPVVLLAGFVGFMAAALAIPRFGPRTRRAQQVDVAAHAAFSRHGVYRTAERVGVLVYVSNAERSGRILYDSGVAREIGDDVRDAWRARLPLLKDAADLIELIDEMGERLGHALPRGESDTNELPDLAAG